MSSRTACDQCAEPPGQLHRGRHLPTHTVHIRGSKDLTVPPLAVSPTTWTFFVDFAGS
ncbi:DUF397 domain-containing protein [Streptomyces sp. SID14515]|uniref:DUF397 domain-containing protein n=1 Tax=Streptomyces sp. SID14515 TaxID=2706074 RepID=UPI0013CA4201|nr:DUF397 domain-containing protein [Streptomyces sp. SID14515]